METNSETAKGVHTVLVNSTPDASRSGETLQSLQENFLMQDDLTTFLDACISSLDRQLPPMDGTQRSELNEAREKLAEIERNRTLAKSDYSEARLRAERASGADKTEAEEKVAAIERYLAGNASDADLARQKFEEVLGRVQPVSRFGEYCQTTALGELLRANTFRIRDRMDMIQEERRLLEVQARTSAMRACESVLTSTSGADAASRKACTKTLQDYAKETAEPKAPAPQSIVSR